MPARLRARNRAGLVLAVESHAPWLAVRACGPKQGKARPGVQVTASSSEVSSDDGHGDRERAEEAAGHAGDRDERQKDHDRRDGGADQRREISCRALRTASARVSPASRWSTMFSTTTMASSMTRPMAAASPPSVIRLKLSP